MPGLSLIIRRGFGFVTFADVSGVDKVLEHGAHDLDGKKVKPSPNTRSILPIKRICSKYLYNTWKIFSMICRLYRNFGTIFHYYFYSKLEERA